MTIDDEGDKKNEDTGTGEGGSTQEDSSVDNDTIANELPPEGEASDIDEGPVMSEDQPAPTDEDSETEAKEGGEESAKGGGEDDIDGLDFKSAKETEQSRIDSTKELGAIYDVSIQISAVLGSATMTVNELLKLGRGAVVELDKRVGEPIDIFVNDRLIARGEIVVLDDRLGITLTEIIRVHQMGAL